jgi:hypothetical protein
MRWHCRFRILGLSLLLLVGVSCSASDGLTGVSDQPPHEVSPLLGDLVDGLADGDLDATVDGAITGVVEVTDLLTCSQQRYAAVTRTIGPDGGTIRVGDHQLEIPANALSKRVTITAEQMQGSTNSVRFSPEGLQFEKPARLTLSYRNCVVMLLPKSIVYTTENLKILEVFRSLDLFGKRQVTAPIDHFSRYAVAY